MNKNWISVAADRARQLGAVMAFILEYIPDHTVPEYILLAENSSVVGMENSTGRTALCDSMCTCLFDQHLGKRRHTRFNGNLLETWQMCLFVKCILPAKSATHDKVVPGSLPVKPAKKSRKKKTLSALRRSANRLKRFQETKCC